MGNPHSRVGTANPIHIVNEPWWDSNRGPSGGRWGKTPLRQPDHHFEPWSETMIKTTYYGEDLSYRCYTKIQCTTRSDTCSHWTAKVNTPVQLFAGVFFLLHIYIFFFPFQERKSWQSELKTLSFSGGSQNATPLIFKYVIIWQVLG